MSHFRITAKLGEGGMGEVWRAEDTRLRREVALKVLPEALADDPERLARFRREARLLATLDHPHIARVHSLEKLDSKTVLVLELVEGETLAEHLARGALPVKSAMEVAFQIARALEAAHGRGIVHRDLKPANVKLTPAGEVKVLDFGLAKPITDPGAKGLASSPTMTYSPTTAGTVLGTAAYMSPEQARGLEVDKQSDVWSFGVVLWEMLTGRRLFAGDTLSDVLAAVLQSEPDWEKLPEQTPRALRRVLERCLARAADHRLHDIADARIELEDCLNESQVAGTGFAPAPAAKMQRRRISWGWATVAVMALALSGLVAWFWAKPATDATPMTRLDIHLPPGVELAEFHSAPTLGPSPTVALSPDGQNVVFVGRHANSPEPVRLYLRPLDELEARPVPGTEGAASPFFSSDGDWLGFWAAGALYRIRIAGGEPQTIGPAGHVRGVSWGDDGTILFSEEGAIFEVAVAGGFPELVSGLHSDRGRPLLWPHHLPGALSALVKVNQGTGDGRDEVSVLSLDSGELRTLLTGGSYPRLLGDLLLYTRLGTVLAVPFDPEGPQVIGDPVPVLHNVDYHSFSGGAAMAVSRSGDLVYGRQENPVTSHDLVWFDSGGGVGPGIGDGRSFSQPRLSPDGSRIVAVIRRNAEEQDLWIYEVARTDWRRLTDMRGIETRPIWSPDGRWVYFSSDETGEFRLYRVRANGMGAAESLTAPGREWDFPGAVTPDGRELIFERQTEFAQFDLLSLPLQSDSPRAEPVLATSYSERLASVSPDGRWLAYQSTESGFNEIYVRPYPGPGASVKVSIEGGVAPQWHPNGKAIFYVSGRRLWMVPTEFEPSFRAGRPERVLEFDWDPGWIFGLDVSPERSRFLVERPGEPPRPLRLVYVSNWKAEVERLVREGAGRP